MECGYAALLQCQLHTQNKIEKKKIRITSIECGDHIDLRSALLQTTGGAFERNHTKCCLLISHNRFIELI